MNWVLARLSFTRDRSIAALLFTFFFLVITVFQILKPLKSRLFVEHYGAQIDRRTAIARKL